MKKGKQIRQTIDSFETAKNIGSELKKAVVENLGKGFVTDLWEQMLQGGSQKTEQPKSGDLKHGEEISFKREKARMAEPGLDYTREIIHAERRVSEKENHEVKMRIQEIQIEIKKLIGTSRELQVEFKDVSIETMPVKAGKFSLNFFEWILSQIRRARMRIEDSAHWTKALTSKKSQRQYWALYKKHGAINFGLSGERVVATQAG